MCGTKKKCGAVISTGMVAAVIVSRRILIYNLAQRWYVA